MSDLENSLLSSLKERVNNRIEEGIYTSNDIERVYKMGLNIKENDKIDALLSLVNSMYDTTREEKISSHRRYVGWIIVLFKNILIKTLKPLTKILLHNQVIFNENLVRLLNSSVPSFRDNINGLKEEFTKRYEDLLIKYEELILKYFEVLERNKEIYKGYEKLKMDIEYERNKITNIIRGDNILIKSDTYTSDRYIGLKENEYLEFEDRHRGSRNEVKEKLSIYIPYFKNLNNILDVGCGRGEFLELLKNEEIDATGIDINEDMVNICNEFKLNVIKNDLISYLNSLKDNSLGGIFSSQVVEHLNIDQLIEFIKLGYEKIYDGGCFIAETINPLCLTIFSGAFYLDPSHTKPIHPETMRFILEIAGFRNVEIIYTSPYPQESKLTSVDYFHKLEKFEDTFINVVNNNINRLNELLYGHQDYAVIGRK